MTTSERERLIIDHLPFVRLIATKFYRRNTGIEYDELCSIGTLGLIDAADKWNPARENTFKTYAEFRIRGAILDFFRAQDSLPRSVRDRLKLIEKHRMVLAGELEREPTPAEVAARVGISVEEYHETIDMASPALLSIDNADQFTPRDRRALTDLCSEDDPSNGLDRINLADYLQGRDLEIVQRHFDGELLKDIAVDNRITESRASQILQHARLKIINEYGKPAGARRMNDPQLLSTVDAAKHCGVNYLTFSEWVRLGYVQPGNNEGRKKFRIADLDRIRALRVKYGRAWVRHRDDTEWTVPEPLGAPTVFIGSPGGGGGGSSGTGGRPIVQFEQQSSPRSSTEEMSPEDCARIAICQKLIRRARALSKDGKHEAALEVMWAAIDELFGPEAA